MKLFSYGTLQQDEVQLSTFNRLLKGEADILQGYLLKEIRITDEEVIAKSGKEFHPILVYSGNENDQVRGMVFDISLEELLNADKYEVNEYKRVEICLRSGIMAWVYVMN